MDTLKLGVSMASAVDTYIKTNILHSDAWDMCSMDTKNKAVNNAMRILTRFFPATYKDNMPIEHVAEQSVWMLRVDDMFQRAELGATYINCDGVAINLAQKDRTLAPFIMQVNGVTAGFGTRKVGRYAVGISDTRRKGW